jgi:TolA-binding protein
MSASRLVLGLLLATASIPAWAQSRGTLDARVERVEKELRAVQRKVFPGGEQAFTSAEIAPEQAVAPTGVPASTPLADLNARVGSLEQAVTQLTAQVEQAEHRLTVLSEQSAKDRQEFQTRLQLIEAAAAPAVAAPLAPADEAPLPVPAGTRTPPRSSAATAVPPAPPPAAGAAATGSDAAEAAYMDGYRLWEAKKYGEAQTSLAAVVKKYPKHRRASYAQNLLGRAYLDAGQPARAAEAFARNYQTNPKGERAPDSLYYLGQSLVALKKPEDACRVYDELDTAYGASLSAALKTRVATARSDAKCR